MNLNKWLDSVATAGKALLGQKSARQTTMLSPVERLVDRCEQLLSSKGEALGTALACKVVDDYLALTAEERLGFFQQLQVKFAADHARLDQAISRYRESPNGDSLYGLHKASEPRRQELFHRINMAPNGTRTIVGLRADLLAVLKAYPELSEVDGDLRHLMRSWFNRGFLGLVQIDWQTPAHILEKLISYEAVHAMNGWDDLRRRLADDRRCFAFFHPAMEDEPLIFVEVALTNGLSGSVQELLTANINPEMQHQADTAIFYSISDCQAGLKGISFGNFLIKQVVMELRQQLPKLEQFATLSPIPQFVSWLKSNKDLLASDSSLERLITEVLRTGDSTELESLANDNPLKAICAHYLAAAKRGELPMDPVARFHLRNGASIGQLNWLGDRSANGIKQSLGMMVNYCYELKSLEQRHESYVNDYIVASERTFQKQLAGWAALSRG